jgi:hypothetical protein
VSNIAETITLPTLIAFRLLSWGGNYEESDLILHDCLSHAESPEAQAQVLRLRSRNHFVRNNYPDALKDVLAALKVLGVDIDPITSREDADALFDDVKLEILTMGFENILAIPKTAEPRVELATQLLNDAATNAYWATESFVDVIGLKVRIYTQVLNWSIFDSFPSADYSNRSGVRKAACPLKQ